MRSILVAAAILVSIPAALAADANDGKALFSRCAACHTANKGGGNGLGPNLFGITGRKAASLPSYMYSSALRSSGIIWTSDKLKAWISAPQRLVPGTKMAFAGISNPAQADDVVAYLNTLK